MKSKINKFRTQNKMNRNKIFIVGGIQQAPAYRDCVYDTIGGAATRLVTLPKRREKQCLVFVTESSGIEAKFNNIETKIYCTYLLCLGKI